MRVNDKTSGFLRLDRRTLFGLLGAGVLQAAAQRNDRLTFPAGAVIRTVLKDLPPAELTGATLFHEHINDTVDDVQLEMLAAAKELGVGCIVNAKSERPINAANIRTISTRANIHIVSCAGYYMEYAYPPALAGKSEDQIADEFTEEARRERHGAFGEIGQSPNTRELPPAERKLFRAVGKAHLKTNLPISRTTRTARAPTSLAKRA